MSNAIVPRQDLDTITLGRILAKSGYFSDAREEAQAIVKILAGQELGYPPIASMTGIHIINGKPTLSAGLIAATIKRSGKYNYRVAQLDADACEIIFFEGQTEIGRSRFTLQDAKDAGALNGKNAHTWKAYGRNMLFARAISNGARWHVPDIFGGPVYMPEEMGVPVDEDGSVIEVMPAGDTRSVRIQASTGEIVEPEEPPVHAAEQPRKLKYWSRLNDLVLESKARGLKVDDAEQMQMAGEASIDEITAMGRQLLAAIDAQKAAVQTEDADAELFPAGRP